MFKTHSKEKSNRWRIIVNGFINKERFYEQVEGIITSNPLGPTMADFFMPHLENKIFAENSNGLLLPNFYLQLHLHGRVLAARIDILPFLFLKSRRSLTRRKIHMRFCLRDIARHAPKTINSQQSLTRERF